MDYSNSLFKRIIDLFIAFIAGIIAFPILGICAIAIKLDSPGPVFFLQDRVGKGGKLFKIYKLRTMVKDAPNLGPVLTQRSDPRITKIGAFLRKTSFDELPQIINVFNGEMSIVGPRPEVPSIVDTYSSELREVFKYKPGITGISQISGRAELEVEEKVRKDIAYQKQATFWSDCLILLKTPWVIISNRGNVM